MEPSRTDGKGVVDKEMESQERSHCSLAGLKPGLYICWIAVCGRALLV